MYSDEQLQELRQYESEIRHAEIKSLCNGASVTKMRAIIRNLLDHILTDQAAAPELLAACVAFVEAYEKSLQLEKTDIALGMAKLAIEKAQTEFSDVAT